MKVRRFACLALLLVACGGQSTRLGGGGGSGGSETGGTGATNDAGAAHETGGSNTSVGGATSANGGSGTPAGGATGAIGGAGAAGVPAVACSDDPFLGTWRGNVLDPSLTPRQTLTLELARKNAEIVGTLTYGEGAPPPPPTDPNKPWPPEYWSESIVFDYLQPPSVVTAFPYTVEQVARCDGTLHFEIPNTEPWQDFCALQRPLHNADGGWACVLRGNGASVNHVDGCTTYLDGKLLGSYPEFKCAVCGADPTAGYCACTATNCSADSRFTLDYELSLVPGDVPILVGADPSCPGCSTLLERQK